jgi:aldehyde dehydrogenase (NAD+)
MSQHQAWREPAGPPRVLAKGVCVSYVSKFALQYIDGQWRSGSGSWDIIDVNPYTGDKLAAITVATVDDVDEAYRAAERAQKEWGRLTPFERQDVFERAARVAEDHEPEIVEAIIEELGATYGRAKGEAAAACKALREAAQTALRVEGRLLPSPHQGKENRLYRIPVGVVGVISPYHFPLIVALKSVAPALALGNAVVLKPHQNTPVVGGTLIARIFEEAGLPQGLINVVVTDTAEIGDAFLEHPAARVIAYTGSVEVGRHVAAVSAGHFKRTMLEMGGNNALIVLDDADVDFAVNAAVYSRFTHQGQSCMAIHRILLDRAVEQEFTEKFVAKVRTLRVGDPRDPQTHIGPLIDIVQARAINALVDQAVADGATALLRGATEGTMMDPVVLTGLPRDALILRRELLGPVALLVPFDGEDDAVRCTNDSPYGLTGAVHTADIERGVRIAQQIVTGMMHVNDSTISDEPLVPFGGEKQSGMGRLNGESAVDAFTTQKWISIQHGRPAFPF